MTLHLSFLVFAPVVFGVICLFGAGIALQKKLGTDAG